MPLITVFTPTYNRARLLPRLYTSLCNQTCKDFEWIIVDDGSTDNTEEIVNSEFKGQRIDFPIKYYKQENGGKHTAINRGVKEAKGVLFLILDSDDELPNDSIATIKEEYKEIKGNNDIGGLCGFMAHRNGKIIGQLKEGIYSTPELEYKVKLKGDLCEVFRIDVLRKYPFPEISGERFCPEDLIWYRLTDKYKLKLIPKVLYYRDYLVGGLSDNIIRIRMNSPIASMITYQEKTTYKAVPVTEKIKAAINYWRFRFCYKPSRDKNCKIPKLSPLLNIFAPLGLLMHIQDFFKVSKH